MTTRKGTKTFEAALKRLEEIVDALEEGEASLDEAMALYEEGLELSRFCGEKLKATELRLKKLSKTIDGQFELTDFDEQERS